MNYTKEQAQAVAEKLGFGSMELAVEFFKEKLMKEGLYEELKAKSQNK